MEWWNNNKVVSFLPEQEIEPEARQQIINTASVPFLYKHLAVMPDCHYGKGSTVGTVIATKGAVIPAAVGVDIGCGMIAVKTQLKRSSPTLRDTEAGAWGYNLDLLEKIREGIERRIPTSAGKYNGKISDTAKPRVERLEDIAKKDYKKLFGTNWQYQIGTLGSGNHFIELAEDQNGCVWVVLHSGSRGIGNKIAQHHIKIAQALMKQYHITLADEELAYLAQGTPEYDDYLQDVHWAQQFALANREEMMDRVLAELSHTLFDQSAEDSGIEVTRINCHHNFTATEHHMGEKVLVTRKGAIKADTGDWGFIPGSMGTRSYIVEGKGNVASFHSAPHGAGRRMSRNKARATFTMEDFDKQLKDVVHRRSETLLDEIPGAYKDIGLVMEQASDLVDVRYTLKQFLNVKGD